MEGKGTLRGVSCTQLHDHCDLTCTFSLLRREGLSDLTVLKQRMAGTKAVQWSSSLQINYPNRLHLGSLMRYDTRPLIPRGALSHNVSHFKPHLRGTAHSVQKSTVTCLALRS